MRRLTLAFLALALLAAPGAAQEENATYGLVLLPGTPPPYADLWGQVARCLGVEGTSADDVQWAVADAIVYQGYLMYGITEFDADMSPVMIVIDRAFATNLHVLTHEMIHAIERTIEEPTRCLAPRNQELPPRPATRGWPMRTTQSTIQALERLTDALGWDLDRDGKSFVVVYPDLPEDLEPVGKTSARALALLVTSVQHREDFPTLQAATAFDPGWTQTKVGGALYIVPAVPDMIAWEEEALALLAAPFHPENED